MQVNVVDFYDEDFLKTNGYSKVYYDASLVKKSESMFGFHYQLPTILFFYIFNCLKETAAQFLSVIKSKEFLSSYKLYIKTDRYNFEYPDMMHHEIFKYLNSTIPQFDMFLHLLNYLSDMGYSDGSMTVYKIERIKNCIKNLDGFNFTKVDLLKI